MTAPLASPPRAASQPLLARLADASNPLDWRPIDRLLLLGSLVMLAPLLFGVGLLLGRGLTPEFLRPGVSLVLLAFYSLHGVVLGGFLAAAWRRRTQDDDWPALENVIIGSFVINVLVTGFATGTHYTAGLLLIFLGINVASALANIARLRVGYLWVCACMLLFAVLDLTGVSRYAPLFTRVPLGPDGAPLLGWLLVQVILAGVLLAISSISMAAISRWVAREELYREMSTIDGLTRLTNRRCFIERGLSEVSRAQRGGTGPVACVMIDLDHFKHINDTWGHHAGDQVLVAAASIMQGMARQYDEVGRYGGEEFALLLPGATLEAAAQVAERIRERLAATPVEVDGRHVSMTASFGVAIYPSPGVECLNGLLKAADRALYQAKDKGRNRVCLADAA